MTETKHQDVSSRWNPQCGQVQNLKKKCYHVFIVISIYIDWYSGIVIILSQKSINLFCVTITIV